jgi:type I restriction enzyme S subunit
MEIQQKSPDLRFDGFTEDWWPTELGNLIQITSASRVHKNEWTKSGVPFFRSSDVVAEYKGKQNTLAFISYKLFQELSSGSGSPKQNDLLVTGGGSIGIPYLVKDNRPLYFKDADLLWLKNSPKIDAYFLYNFFSTEIFKKYVKSITHIGTISHYTVEQAKSTPINVPKIAEQIRIGDFLRNTDELIADHQTQLTKLKNLKKAMVVKMFPQKGASVPEIRFKGFDGDWTFNAFEDVFNYHRPDPYIVNSTDYSNNYRTPVLTANKGFVLGYTSETDTFNKESIIFDDFTLDSKYVDFPFMVKSSALKILTINEVKRFDLYFSFLLLKNAKIEVLGHARHYIAVVQPTKVFIPKIDEQKKISKYFKNLEGLIENHQEQLKKLNNIKKACLSKLFVA